MKFKNKSLVKVAALSLVAAFSFGLSVSCLSERKPAIETKAEPEGSWTCNNKNLSFAYAQPQYTYINTEQYAISGTGSGNYEVVYTMWGSDETDVTEDMEFIEETTLYFENGYFIHDTTSQGIFGTITATPINATGLEETPITFYVLTNNYSGDMNEVQIGLNYDATNSCFILIDETGEKVIINLVSVEYYPLTSTATLTYNKLDSGETFNVNLESAAYFEETNISGTWDNTDVSINVSEADVHYNWQVGWNYYAYGHRLVYQPENAPSDWNALYTEISEIAITEYTSNQDATLVHTYLNNSAYNSLIPQITLSQINYNSLDNTLTGIPDSEIPGSDTTDITITTRSIEPTYITPATSVNFSVEDISINVGETGTIPYVVEPSTATDIFTWTSENQEVATVDSNGTITALKQGNTVITIRSESNVDVYDSLVISVFGINYTVSIKNGSDVVDEITCEVGDNLLLSASIDPQPATDLEFTWSSGDQSVATVDSYGEVTCKGEGLARITVTETNTGASAAISLTVNSKQQQHVTGIQIGLATDSEPESLKSLNLYAGESRDLIIIPYPTDAVYDVTWESSHPDYLEVTPNENGSTCTITALAPLGENITLRAIDSELGSTNAARVSVYIAEAPTPTLLIYKGTELIENGNEVVVYDTTPIQLYSEVESSTEVSLTWSSSNTNVANFDSETGYLVPSGTVGSTQISLTDTISGASVSFTLIFSEPQQTYIEFLELRYNGSAVSYLTQEINTVFSLIPYYEPVEATTEFVWESSSPSAATVSNTGEITCVGAGTSVITCTEVNSKLSFTCTVNVVLPSGLYYDAANNAFKFNDTTAYRLEMYKNTYFHSASGEEDTAYIQYSLINESTGEEASIQNIYLRETQLIETSDAYYIRGSWVEANGYTRSTPQDVELIYEEKPTIYLEGFNFDEENHKFKLVVGSKEEEITYVTESRAVYDNGSVSVYFSGTDAVLVMTECEIVRNPDELNRFEITGYYSNSDEPVTFFLRATIQEIEGWSDDPVTTYEVTLDPNGGDGVMEPIPVKDGKITVPKCEFEWEDHTFLYWSTEEGGMYRPGEVISGIEGSFTLIAMWKENDKPVPAADPIKEETIEEINTALDNMELSDEQKESINNKIIENQEYISDDTGAVISEAVNGTVLDADPEIAEAQKELVVTVVETAVEVDAGKATDIQHAQKIDKALPESADFSVEGEINEFYARQMYELFGGEAPVTKSKTRATTSSYSINVYAEGETTAEKQEYLANEQELYGLMVDFVDTGVDHMGDAALKLRVCSGESVTVEVKSYVTTVKVSSYREFDKAQADKEFVEAIYKAIILSMQNEVISILEKDHKPSSNAEKEAQYQKELEAVKDFETFEIMVAEVLRQKYVALTGNGVNDVEEFMPIYWQIFTAWALDEPSPYDITLEELTTATIDASTNRARAFTVNSNLTGGEWGFIGGVVGGAAIIIAASAVIPTLLKKKKEKEGTN